VGLGPTDLSLEASCGPDAQQVPGRHEHHDVHQLSGRKGGGFAKEAHPVEVPERGRHRTAEHEFQRDERVGCRERKSPRLELLDHVGHAVGIEPADVLEAGETEHQAEEGARWKWRKVLGHRWEWGKNRASATTPRQSVR
jgi:hypothetical protein